MSNEELKRVVIDFNEVPEVLLENQNDFLKVAETLTRMGIASKRDNTLFQSCHILHKKGRYFILSFKELFALDGRPTNITEEDIGRRNAIARILGEWGLVKNVRTEDWFNDRPITSLSKIKILPYKDKENWMLVPKYRIGKK